MSMSPLRAGLAASWRSRRSSPQEPRIPGNVGLDELFFPSVNYVTHLDRFLELFCRAWADGPSIWEMSEADCPPFGHGDLMGRRYSNAMLAPPLSLRREAGEALVQVGDTAPAQRCYQQALERIAAGAAIDPVEHPALLAAQGRLLQQTGEPDQALVLFERAHGIMEAAGDQERSAAVVLGDIARLRANKGEVDQALALHEKVPRVYEALAIAVRVPSPLAGLERGFGPVAMIESAASVAIRGQRLTTLALRTPFDLCGAY
jgi:tetratricopeptide (TPR) repeat protein